MDNNNVRLFKADINDLPELQDIAVQTFKETFDYCNTEEDMSFYIERSFSPARLKKELEEKQSEFYIAVFNGKAAGYLKINFGNTQTDIRDKNAMEIERIYTLKEFHGKGVGQLLFNRAVQSAEEAGVNYIWLGVWEKNYRAQKFYEKNGFRKFREHVFKLGKDEQTDFLMKLEIKNQKVFQSAGGTK